MGFKSLKKCRSKNIIMGVVLGIHLYLCFGKECLQKLYMTRKNIAYVYSMTAKNK